DAVAFITGGKVPPAAGLAAGYMSPKCWRVGGTAGTEQEFEARRATVLARHTCELPNCRRGHAGSGMFKSIEYIAVSASMGWEER
ncbi:hypothetical protein, partial [Mesorhizobium sp. M7A.F.Ca.US.014.04.1.1]|uniref:hypothetical protein n=1 Tax=Mesorhizobium sp. M7A.F.Ca.US.014.04.1.1 TaxID=2496744 RepID=UPI0019D16501